MKVKNLVWQTARVSALTVLCGLCCSLPISAEPSAKPPITLSKEIVHKLYMADLCKRIKRAWFPPKGTESKKVRLVFIVSRDGSLSNLKLQQSCGLAIVDNAAMKAVENAAPFRPLPPGAPETINVAFAFDYTCDGGVSAESQQM